MIVRDGGDSHLLRTVYGDGKNIYYFLFFIERF